MAEINANMVKELREKTNAGFMDCKKALTETGGNFEEAIDWLRKKGLSSAAKKASRVAKEGLVGVIVKGNCGAVVEVNSETDFVARNDKFQAMVRTILELTINSKENNAEAIIAMPYPGTSHNVETEIKENIAVIGENMNLRRVTTLSVNEGIIASYLHNAIVDNLGKIGILVRLESKADKDKLTALGKQIAMHIATSKPDFLAASEVDAKTLEREKLIYADQARNSGKPESIIEKMVEGRIRKFYEEVVLLEQTFFIDGKTKISELVANASKEFGTEVKLTGFVRYHLGEGIEKEETDFAAEVAAAIKN